MMDMAWYWLALILGIIAPWLVLTRDLVSTFRDDGLQAGLATWIAFGLVTVPVMFIIVGLSRLLVE